MVEWATMMVRSLRLLAAFISLMSVLALDWHNIAIAADPITIREIFDEPRSFHLKQVVLHGTVRNVQPLDPYKLPAGTTCYGAYL